jgi:hypothetical protein
MVYSKEAGGRGKHTCSRYTVVPFFAGACYDV